MHISRPRGVFNTPITVSLALVMRAKKHQLISVVNYAHHHKCSYKSLCEQLQRTRASERDGGNAVSHCRLSFADDRESCERVMKCQPGRSTRLSGWLLDRHLHLH